MQQFVRQSLPRLTFFFNIENARYIVVVCIKPDDTNACWVNILR